MGTVNVVFLKGSKLKNRRFTDGVYGEDGLQCPLCFYFGIHVFMKLLTTYNRYDIPTLVTIHLIYQGIDVIVPNPVSCPKYLFIFVRGRSVKTTSDFYSPLTLL